MVFRGRKQQMVASKGLRNAFAENSQQMKADMATMVATGGIAIILGIVGRKSGSGFMLCKNRVAVKRPRSAESEDGQNQPQREEAFEHAHGTLINRLSDSYG